MQIWSDALNVEIVTKFWEVMGSDLTRFEFNSGCMVSGSWKIPWRLSRSTIVGTSLTIQSVVSLDEFGIKLSLTDHLGIPRVQRFTVNKTFNACLSQTMISGGGSVQRTDITSS
jgi:hypothetical protein